MGIIEDLQEAQKKGRKKRDTGGKVPCEPENIQRTLQEGEQTSQC